MGPGLIYIQKFKKPMTGGRNRGRRQGETMARSLVDTKINHETFGTGLITAEQPRDGREPLLKIVFEGDEKPFRLFQRRDVLNDDGPFHKA
jgi:hypothetical protein